MAILKSGPEAFLRDLQNAGLAEPEAQRMVLLAREFEAARGRGPRSAEDVAVFARERAMGSLAEEARIADALGSYLVFLRPEFEFDTGAAVRAVIGFEPDEAIGAVARGLEGEGPLARFFRNTLGAVLSERVSRWFAPAATVIVLAIVFLENPIYRMFNPASGEPPRISTSAQPAHDPAMQRLSNAAGLASELARRLEHYWKQGPAPPTTTLSALVDRLPQTDRFKFAALVKDYELDDGAWRSAVERERGFPREYVLRHRRTASAVIVVSPDAATAVDGTTVLLSGGSR